MEENKNKEIIILNELYNVLKKQEFNLVDRIKIYYNTLLGIENNNNQDYLDNLDTIPKIDNIIILNENISNIYSQQKLLNQYMHLLKQYNNSNLLCDKYSIQPIYEIIKTTESDLFLKMKDFFDILFDFNTDRNKLVSINNNYNEICKNIEYIKKTLVLTDNIKILNELHILHTRKYKELCNNQTPPIGCIVNDRLFDDKNHSHINYCTHGCELCESFIPFEEYFSLNQKSHILSKLILNINFINGSNIELDCNYHMSSFETIINSLYMNFKDFEQCFNKCKEIQFFLKNNDIIYKTKSSNYIDKYNRFNKPHNTYSRLYNKIKKEDIINNTLFLTIIFCD